MRYLIVAFMFAFCGGYGSEISCLDDPLYVIEIEVLRHLERDLGRPTQPENGIAELKKNRLPISGAFAEYFCIREGLERPGKSVSDRIVKWVHALISTPNTSQTCLYRVIQVNERLKILRYQYKITGREQLKEIARWSNKASLYEDYNSDTGFLVLEFVHEKVGDSWVQTYLRISADWEGIDQPLQTVHRAPECLKREKIKREKPH